MKASAFLVPAFAASVLASSLPQARQSNWTVGQTVQTSSGPVNGHAASNATGVSEYLGIPFAQPPIGDLRFAAPVAYNGTATINGTNFGYTCPQQSSHYNLSLIQEANITTAGINLLQQIGTTITAQSEDCLTLNVWTKPQTGEKKKAVLLWIYGGGFNSGSTAIRAYNGQHIVDEEDVIVVSVNYRVNIFGFPGNPAGPANVGLLDQRLGVEWVRDNIEAFGGDPARITLFGQSAGGASVDLYNYAWVEDPIVAGFIPESGTALSWALPNSAEITTSAWYNVSAKLGCGDASSSAESVLTCMRTKNTTAILDGISGAGGTAGILGNFVPTADEKVVFSNYTERSAAGNFTKKPVLLGNNDNEAGLFIAQFALQGITYPASFWNAFNIQSFTCPSGVRANVSIQHNVPTWRYRYFGDFPDTEIYPGVGTWHGAEIPLLFDTNIATLAQTQEQIAIGNYVRGAWAAFAKDPEAGLDAYGWPRYEVGSETLLRLAWDNKTGTNAVDPVLYDQYCSLVNISSTDPDVPAGLPNGTSGSGNASTGTGGPAQQTTSDAGMLGVSTGMGLVVLGLMTGMGGLL
ncbi:hypothetical protein CJF30_00005273 [Rutstroemia sp. NJR-2017a BBW]|nr:hypothetical protein CJF30_00005273 [Rutstroemia sp. NJR-2017a BBW]